MDNCLYKIIHNTQELKELIVNIRSYFETSSSSIHKARNEIKIIDFNGKELVVKKEIDLEYITKYQNNPELPSGMIQVVQEGIDGKQEEITKKIYEGDKLTEEKIVGNTVTKASVNKIVEVGTGRHIINYNAEIGDDIYITPSFLAIRIEPNEKSEKLITLNT